MVKKEQEQRLVKFQRKVGNSAQIDLSANKKTDNETFAGLSPSYQQLRKITCGAIRMSGDAEEIIFGEDVLPYKSKMRFVGIPYKPGITFPNVKKIIIKKSISGIYISNKTFPNVKEVVSENPKYLSGRMLIANDGTDENKNPITVLKNSFCMEENETIDLKGVVRIAENAFAGCKSVKVINTEKVQFVNYKTFSGSNFTKEHLKPVDGIFMAGTIIVSADADCLHYVIPKTATAMVDMMKFNPNGELIVKNAKLFFEKGMSAPLEGTLLLLPRKVVIDDDILSTEERIRKFIDNNLNLEDVEIKKDNPKYAAVDGLICDKKAKTVIKCLHAKEGDITIPDWIEEISDSAFERCRISSVTIPRSVRRIGFCAFSECPNLAYVNIYDGVKRIPANCFRGCRQLLSIEIPASVVSIEKDAFFYCSSLSEVTLHEGLGRIGIRAFVGCDKIPEIKIPASVRRLENLCFRYVKHITLKSERLPYNLIFAISAIGENNNMEEPTVVETKSGIFFVPHIMRKKDVYSIDKKQESGDDKFLDYLSDYTTNVGTRRLHAFYESRNHQWEYKKDYVARSGKFLADYFVSKKQEENLSALLNSGILSKNTVKYIYGIIPDDMPNAKAYALNLMEKVGYRKTGFSL